ncbi:hypothetical protein [Deinococcus ruber]|uniref:Uncharacterized protein n=1 Tax=Deinococcus ruber TaxID=1848197 RepID=A0A918CC19_9DEIO|nr:hypothetical protein [Deinococcus ruber]GGR15524.1 hypothetical protein GCM10008957_30330 [Deinococcus ruber]
MTQLTAPSARPTRPTVHVPTLVRRVIRWMKAEFAKDGILVPMDLVRWMAARMAVMAVLTRVTLQGMASAQGTPAALNQALDAKATTFCSYVDVLPDSKWVKAGAMVMLLIGASIMIFGGRGGSTWLMRSLGAVILIPSLIAVGKAFGMVC